MEVLFQDVVPGILGKLVLTMRRHFCNHENSLLSGTHLAPRSRRSYRISKLLAIKMPLECNHPPGRLTAALGVPFHRTI